jgi:uncharacterized sporulation protein YeaH/YhbH (DUF444 family)
MGIKEDKARFMDIVKGKIKQNLSKYISHGEIVGKKEDEFVKIPIPQIDIPNFRFGSKNDEQGVGQGDGTEDGSGQPSPGPGTGQAGDKPGEHIYETEISVDDLASILGESLELPKIEPKGNKNNLDTIKNKYTSLAPVGPKGLKHFKATYKRALKRSLASGIHNSDSLIIPIRDDFKYKSSKPVKKPQTQAVIFYLMDISGSMGTDQKRIVQTEVFWINAWIKKHYKNLDVRFIAHDSDAQEVSEQDFFTVSAGGGTLISSAYNLCKTIIEKEYSPQEYNIYVFHFSDGDNWSEEDNKKSVQLIRDFFAPRVNSFNYGQVNSPHGTGNFIRILEHISLPNLITSAINSKDDIVASIKKFLGKGH